MRRLLAFVAEHHNKLQFVGYELANVVLVVHEYQPHAEQGGRFSVEALAALALLAGSACIWRFDGDRRPSMLFYGGISLAAGGVLLAAAGYGLTGVAVALASLETARGGFVELEKHSTKRAAAGEAIAPPTRFSCLLSSVTLGWYVALVRCLASRSEGIGTFIDGRPFLTGMIIKAPMRLEFVLKKAFDGDAVGAAVGLSWMVLGDGGLAINDPKLRAGLRAYARPAGFSPEREPVPAESGRQSGLT